jgi:hypothetical protein
MKACSKPLYISSGKSKSILFWVRIPRLVLRTKGDSFNAWFDLGTCSCLPKRLASNVPINKEPRNVRIKGQVVDEDSAEVDP